MLGSYEVETVEKIDDLRGLRQEWEASFPPGSGEPWQSFSWIEAAASTCSRNHRLRIVTVSLGGKLMAVAPLVLKPSLQPLRPLRLDFVGGEELKEPNRFAAHDPSSLDLLVDTIASERTYPVRLSRVPSDEATIRRLTGKFLKAGWITRTMRMPYPYLNLSTGGIRKSLREDLRRARRKAAKHGEVRSEIIAVQSSVELRRSLDTIFRIEASGWKGRNNTAIVSNPARREFFERYGEYAFREGTLRLSFLTIGGQAAAVQYAVETGNGYWLLNIGFDEEFRDASPGNLLLGDTVELAAKQGLGRYNFLGKEEPWIKRWTSEVEDCLVLAAYRANVHGVKAMLSDGLYMLNKIRKARKVREAKLQGRMREAEAGEESSVVAEPNSTAAA